MATIKIHNTETGEIIERDMTADELAQWEADKVANDAKAQAEAQAAQKKVEAEAKLLALGLNLDDLRALGLA